jgi:hypothetical protein
MPDHDSLSERGRALEEEYFRKKDRDLVEKMRLAKAAEQARGELSRQTGLQDPATLKELQDLGFTPDTVALLPFVPLLELAWAEGGITPAEGDLLVHLARDRHIAEGSAADRQLKEWLTHRPAPVVFERAGRLISALLDSGSGEIREGLTAEKLVEYCEEIAHASGGVFGTRMRSVSGDERNLLTRIAGELKTRKR